jgi:hypothetical protein
VNGRPRRPIGGGMIVGIILILLGIVFALDSMGVLYAGDLFSWWPLILIGIGVTRMAQSRSPEQRIGFGILTVIGVFFLLRNLHVPWLHRRDIFPVMLLLVGGLLVWQALFRRRAVPSGAGPSPAEETLAAARERLADRADRPVPSEALPGTAAAADTAGSTRGAWVGRTSTGDASVLHEFAFMGGGDRVVRSQDFRGGEVTAIMGGFHFDLRSAAMAGDSATIEIFTLWGGVDFRVPEDWNVVVQGVPILGVFTTTGRPVNAAPASKTLILSGTAIMGGVEVKY